MVKKKQIREEFDKFFKMGNEKEIKKYLTEYPWLLSEISNEMLLHWVLWKMRREGE